MPQSYWAATQEWPQETVFIVGGGPSVLTQPIEALRGRRVIVINSSVFAVPWSDILYFADFRWYCEPPNRAALESFRGRVITTSRKVFNERVLLMRAHNPPGLAYDQDALAVRLTSFTATMNLAAHLIGRGGTIVTLGMDGQVGPDGRTWHHAPHKWAPLKDRYRKHRQDIASMVEPLKAVGITVLNASPGSAYADLWPVVDLRDVLGDRGLARAA